MFVATVASREVYVETSKKMKILGVKCWRIMMPSQIQLGEYSMSSDTDGISHIAT